MFYVGDGSDQAHYANSGAIQHFLGYDGFQSSFFKKNTRNMRFVKSCGT